MSKSYLTTSSSLFAKNTQNNIPNWIDDMNITQDNHFSQLDNVSLDFTKLASFMDAPKVSRDGRDYNSRPIINTFQGNRAVLAAKTELARFLTGKHYTCQAYELRNGVKLEINISNVPATFTFQYNNQAGKLIHASTFTINVVNNDKEGTVSYPFSKAGLNECLDDLKHGRVKTADKAKSYTAYTVTLDEVVKRFNGDARKAMDRVRELIASQDIIGVESNTFATVYAIDSLFPKMKKEGSIDNEPTFEFVNNREHVAVNPNSSAASLILDASKTLKDLFEDFRIYEYHRDNNELTVTADVLLNNKNNRVNFKFGISHDQIDDIQYCEVSGRQLTLEKFLKENHSSNLLNTYIKRMGKTAKRITRGIILTKEKIRSSLQRIASSEIIDAIINNWEERELIIPLNSHTFSSPYSFTDLLNKVDTKLLTADELRQMQRYAQKYTNEIERLEQQDTGRRNDKALIYSKSIRLANLYNKINPYLNQFTFVDSNEDVTKVKLINYSERGAEKLQIVATYKGNFCLSAKVCSKKIVTASLQAYKKRISSKNIFAKSVFTDKMLKQAISGIFKNPNRVELYI